MTSPELFWAVFAAVLSAILLGGCFFWGLIAYSRHERNGTAGGWGSHLPLIAIIMPLLFGFMAYYIALDLHWPWLEFIAQ